MSTEKPDKPLTDEKGRPFFEDPNAALRQIAQNPAAYARYVADFHRVVLDMQAKLEVLQHETRVHCRGTRVEGDKRGQAFLRSFPVESPCTTSSGTSRKPSPGWKRARIGAMPTTKR